MRLYQSISFAFVTAVLAILVVSCAKDIIDLNGTIHGVVRDSNSGALISNCQVSITPGGKSVLTGTDGMFEFIDLEPGKYTLSFSKAGYEDASKSVTVVSSETTTADIALKAKEPFTASPTKFNFGDLSSSMEVSFFNNSDETTSFTISNIPEWAAFSKTTGSISAGGTMSLTISVNREDIAEGTYSKTVSVAYKGKTNGTVSLTLQMTKVQPSAPTVTIGNAPEAVTNNSFTIHGELTATGGAEVTSYGHCWSENQIPTIEDSKTNHGATREVGPFKSDAYNLKPNTTYYVRAYATNLHGTSYSKQITITTRNVPTVTISNEAETITSNSFTIQGELTATGGAEITSHGICWSENQNPTIENAKADIGARTSIGTFKSTATGLKPSTKYYVRAFATNQIGTSYSEQITVTTQETPPDKWDGQLSSSFAGGSGTSSDPYIIETGGQLLHIKDVNSSNMCFELANNIDLDNKNWLPFEFCGTLDGKGHTISNLKISRDTEYQGLFSIIYFGKVQNLTIKNVNINAPTKDGVGALAGFIGPTFYDDFSLTFSNCHILLTSDSQITGNNYVGGLIGKTHYTRYILNISNCSVEYSGSSDEVIKGNNYVGGIVGNVRNTDAIYKLKLIKSCYTFANIKGSESVGGIIGDTERSTIEQCVYKGSIIGNEHVGGIVGKESYGTCNITSCKADVDLTATSYGGGIVGGRSYNSGSCEITSCYSTGTMNSNSSDNTFGGISGDYAKVKMCYSTICSDITNFDGISASTDGVTYSASVAPSRRVGTNKGNCRDITTWLLESYQTEGSYWNFDKTWKWSGKIDGQDVNVSCPRLAWE